MFKSIYMILIPILLALLIINSKSERQKSLDKEYILIKKIEGEVLEEDFKYHKIGATGDFLIELQSLEGDADLYVSEGNSAPTYKPNEYDLQSVTCGLDQIQVPYDFNRPFTIGIYGHPSHSQSSYILSIYALSNNGSLYEENEKDSNYNNNKKTQNNEKAKKSNIKNKNAADVSTKIGIWALLDVIEMIFL